MWPDLEVRRERGFTLLELMIVVTILGIIASIGVPQYVSALRIARVGKAKHELRTISNAIDAYTANHEGRLPLSLYQVGFGGKQDPFGIPYCYLNYADGTGDGLDWAIQAGLVDPSAFGPVVGGGGGGDGGTSVFPQVPIQGRGVVAVDSASDYTFSTSDANALSTQLGRTMSIVERMAVETAVAESGAFSIFTGVPTEQTRRRDRYMFPLNTDYDLFSLGPDGQTAASLGEDVGLDDVIRANNGGYFGSASEY